MKFEVGDKVRIIASKKRLDGIHVFRVKTGTIGTIVSISDGSSLPYGVNVGTTTIRDCWFFNIKDLELVEKKTANPKIRTFESGATRDTDSNKLDYDGFLSPLAIKRFAQYMHKHRKQSDGTLRDSDNWQKGIPKEAYRKSLWRHFFDLWSMLRGWINKTEEGEDEEALLCAILFNTQGLLHEILKEKQCIKMSKKIQRKLKSNEN